MAEDCPTDLLRTSRIPSLSGTPPPRPEPLHPRPLPAARATAAQQEPPWRGLQLRPVARRVTAPPCGAGGRRRTSSGGQGALRRSSVGEFDAAVLLRKPADGGEPSSMSTYARRWQEKQQQRQQQEQDEEQQCQQHLQLARQQAALRDQSQRLNHPARVAATAVARPPPGARAGPTTIPADRAPPILTARGSNAAAAARTAAGRPRAISSVLASGGGSGPGPRTANAPTVSAAFAGPKAELPTCGTGRLAAAAASGAPARAPQGSGSGEPSRRLTVKEMVARLQGGAVYHPQPWRG